jgi:uncharacterized protein YndB with AHSA1/START domain
VSTQTLEPVQRAVTVAAAPERAFEVFTRGLGSWWPFEPHSITGGPDELVFEEREGGEVYEISGDGERGHWATVLTWEPPSRLVLAWNILEREPIGTELEVRFLPEGDGTRVDLEHRGWEKLTEGAVDKRAEYDTGWDHVLGVYCERAD